MPEKKEDTSTKTSSDEEAKIIDLDELECLPDAKAIVTRNMYWAMGLGVVPFPLVDLATISAIQVKMVRELANLYGLKVSNHLIATTVAALVGGVGSLELGKGVALSLVKFIPGVGSYLGVAAVPVSAGAVTYAIGKIFTLHFESGGTFLSFDPKSVKSFYNDLYEKGKGLTTKIKKEKEPETAS